MLAVYNGKMARYAPSSLWIDGIIHSLLRMSRKGRGGIRSSIRNRVLPAVEIECRFQHYL